MVEQESIQADNEFFKRMIDLIPPSLYFDSEVKEQIKSQLQPEKRENRQNELKRKQKPKGGKERKDKSLKTKLVTEIQSELYRDETDDSRYTEIKAKKPCPTRAPTTTPAATGSGDIDDKRARLRAKIEEFQAKRKLNDSQKHEKRRLKRIESKMKLKEKRKQLKLQQKQQKHLGQGPKGDSSSKLNTPSKPVLNKEGEVVFSKFDFRDSGKKEKLKRKYTGKDYKRLLETIEKRNEKIQKVKDKDEEKGKSLQNKFKWESVINKAEGIKVKDNPVILKRALKRKDKIKEKKKKKWGDRQNTVEKLKDAKQEKRNKNIQGRKQAVIDRKIKKAKKKGRIIPGF